jgi:DNA-binding MarR family transcriptional regulator
MAEDDATLGFLRTLWRLDHVLVRVSKQMSARTGITVEQRLLVRTIGRAPGIAPGALAAELHLDPGTVSAGLARLEARGLIVRRRDSRDRRRVVVHLTSAGRAFDDPKTGPSARSPGCGPRRPASSRPRSACRVEHALSTRLERARSRR